MRVKITQYGLSKHAGGWDPYGDSGTDKYIGSRNNKLVDGVSCALTESAEEGLGCKFGDTLLVTFDDGSTQARVVADRAPEEDARLDMFNALAELPQASTFAEVTIVD